MRDTLKRDKTPLCMYLVSSCVCVCAVCRVFVMKIFYQRVLYGFFSCVLVRFFILFQESSVTELELRANDSELRQLCLKGSALSSSRFRKTCLDLKKSESTPILVKSIVFAILSLIEEIRIVIFTKLSFFLCVLGLIIFITPFKLLRIIACFCSSSQSSPYVRDVEFGRKIFVIENGENNRVIDLKKNYSGCSIWLNLVSGSIE